MRHLSPFYLLTPSHLPLVLPSSLSSFFSCHLSLILPSSLSSFSPFRRSPSLSIVPVVPFFFSSLSRRFLLSCHPLWSSSFPSSPSSSFSFRDLIISLLPSVFFIFSSYQYIQFAPIYPSIHPILFSIIEYLVLSKALSYIYLSLLSTTLLSFLFFPLSYYFSFSFSFLPLSHIFSPIILHLSIHPSYSPYPSVEYLLFIMN